MRTVKREKSAGRKAGKAAETRLGGIQVIARSAEILRVLAAYNGLSLAGIADRVRLPRSTVHRIVLALTAAGLVSSRGPGQYRLGPEITHLAEASKSGIVRDLHPYLVRLSGQINETVDLSVRTGNTVTFVDQIVAPQRLRAVSALGREFPLHCTAPGKAILAVLPDELTDALLSQPLEQLTPRTVADPAALRRQLENVRRGGFAVDREEHTVGICAVGASLRVDGEIVAISIPLPASRFYDHEERLLRALSGTIADIVRDMPSSAIRLRQPRIPK